MFEAGMIFSLPGGLVKLVRYCKKRKEMIHLYPLGGVAMNFSITEGIGYAFVSAVFLGLTPNFLKSRKKSAVAVKTFLFSLIVAAFSFLVAAIDGDLSDCFRVDTSKIISFICYGALSAAALYLLILSFAYGNVKTIVPILCLYSPLVIVAENIMAGQELTLSQILIGLITVAGVVLVCAGSIQIEFRTVLYAAFSLILFTVTSILGGLFFETSGMNENIIRLWGAIVATVILFLVMSLEQSIKRSTSINTGEGVFLVLSGVLAGLSILCMTRAEIYGYSQINSIIAGSAFPISMLAARIIYKEDFNIISMLGVLMIVVIGVFSKII